MAILISINPPHTRNIFSGLKRVEWRHTALPEGTAYVYETKRGGGAGMVIGQVDVVGSALFCKGEALSPALISEGCVSLAELRKYRGNNPNIVANYICNAKLFDAPKELSEFVTEGDCDCMNCAKCAWLDKCNSMAGIEDDCDLAYMNIAIGKSLKPIFRPPQSWCHVEVSA